MITSNFKNKVILTMRENINKFSYKLNGEVKYKKPSIEILNQDSLKQQRPTKM